MKATNVLLITAIGLYAFACAKKDGGSGSSSPAPSTENPEPVEEKNDGTIPLPTIGTGQIVLEVNTTLSDGGASGYIVGNTDLKLE